MKNFKIKSYCKINLYLRILRKLNNGYHKISSLITFCSIHDVMSISTIKGKKDVITFSGQFKKGIDKKSNTVTEILGLIRAKKMLKNQAFKINIKKNIPHGSGLGGGSSNAAYLLKYLNFKMNLNLNKKKINNIARKVGFDVPISLEKKNTLITGKNEKIFRIRQKYRLSLLIVYPNIVCSTKNIYRKSIKKKTLNLKPFFNIKSRKEFINILINEKNDLEKTVIKIYPKIEKIINYIKSQKGCYFSRITGSGSACIGIFSNAKNANYAQKLIRLKYPKYWCVVSKTI